MKWVVKKTPHSMLDSGCRIPDFGFWMRIAGSSILDFGLFKIGYNIFRSDFRLPNSAICVLSSVICLLFSVLRIFPETGKPTPEIFRLYWKRHIRQSCGFIDTHHQVHILNGLAGGTLHEIVDSRNED